MMQNNVIVELFYRNWYFDYNEFVKNPIKHFTEYTSTDKFMHIHMNRIIGNSRFAFNGSVYGTNEWEGKYYNLVQGMG